LGQYWTIKAGFRYIIRTLSFIHLLLKVFVVVEAGEKSILSKIEKGSMQFGELVLNLKENKSDGLETISIMELKGIYFFKIIPF